MYSEYKKNTNEKQKKCIINQLKIVVLFSSWLQAKKKLHHKYQCVVFVFGYFSIKNMKILKNAKKKNRNKQSEKIK